MHSKNFDEKNLNPLSQLSELRVALNPCSTTGDTSLVATIKFGTMEIDENDIEFTVGVSRAYLSLSLYGCRTIMGSNLNETDAKKIILTEKVSQKTATKMNASFSLGEHRITPGGNALIGVDRESHSEVLGERTTTLSPLVSLPNDNWEISTPGFGKGKTWLKGTIISNKEVCKMEPRLTENRVDVLAELSARKKDIEVQTQGNAAKRNLRTYRNKEAVIANLVGQCLAREMSNAGRQRDEKSVILSRCSLEET